MHAYIHTYIQYIQYIHTYSAPLCAMSECLFWRPKVFQWRGLRATIFAAETASVDSEIEWSLADVTKWVWSSADASARATRFNKACDQIGRVYRDLFHKELPQFKQCANSAQKDSTKAMMYQRTIPTSVVCALLVFAASHEHFSAEQLDHINVHAFDWLQILVDRTSLEKLAIRVLGGGGKTVSTDASAATQLSSMAVWDDVIRSTLEELWDRLCALPDRVWHRSTVQTMSIPEFILFSLEAPNVKAHPYLTVAAQGMVAQMMSALDQSKIADGAQDLSLRAANQVGTTLSVRYGLKVQAYFKACKMIDAGEARCFECFVSLESTS